MKGKQIFYWLSLLLCLAVAGCSSDGEDEVTPKDEPGEEGGGEQTGREVWSFDVKVMLDRATFKSYGSSANVVNNKLKQRFKEVRELYRELSRTGVSEQILVKRYGIRSIAEMNAVMRKRALAGLKKTATVA